jgi:flagellar L-ring protein precursor FlgH
MTRPAPSRTEARLRVAATALCALAALSACGRLDHLGKPPTMTAPGAQMPEIAPITPQRAQLAQPYPTPQPEQVAVASTWRSGPTSLFGDRRARTVGDILTVVVEIEDEATISNETNRSRSANEDASVDALFLGLPELADRVFPGEDVLSPAAEIGSASSSSGAGDTTRSEEIELRIAATVTEVLPNGHMVIQGSQEVRVNFELRDLQVAGVIRPEDISRRNEITYDKIADARIAYGGRGQLFDMQQPRYGQQVLDVVMPF